MKLKLEYREIRWWYWVASWGLIARTTIDYCFLARVMSLLPWNLTEPFSFKLLKQRIFSPPTDGSILGKK